MTDWMERLARHYEDTRRRHPGERLMIVFDIDGTILDMRYPILHQLRAFDRAHGTRWFADLRLSDIEEHETRLDDLLARLGADPGLRAAVADFYGERFWTLDALLQGHRAFRGVLEVIRWFQIQPHTFVGLNTGRPEALRRDTLRALNALGAEWKVAFDDDRLVMKEGGWGADTASSKVDGLRRLAAAGYRIFAFIDNEPENLAAAAAAFDGEEILLLHADTIFDSHRQALPRSAVSGRAYDLASLIGEASLPSHVQLVWHGVNDPANLREFLGSRVQWAEVDVRLDPVTQQPVLKREPFDEMEEGERRGRRALALETVLDVVSRRNRAIKIDLKDGPQSIERTLSLIDRFGFDDDRLWFNAEVDALGEKGFRMLRESHPGAVLQCPMDTLSPLIHALPDRAHEILEALRGWGINRYSVAWGTRALPRLVDLMKEWGYAVNVYSVPDLEAFLRASLLLPRSITSDFDFPRWGYRGRGGEVRT